MSNLFTTVLQIAAFSLILASCKPYGDSAKDLGITESNVSQSGLVRSWVSSNGDNLTIASDSTISEANCFTQGSQVAYVSQSTNCNGGLACGSMTFTIVHSGNNIAGCLEAGQYVCTYFTPNSSQSSTTLSCSNSNATFYYQAL